jgi:hypothetical protein
MQVKAEAVDVEAIMRQIRARIREKRGVDYTEAEVQALAQVKLEQFLDPKGVRSDLVAEFRKRRAVSPPPPNYKFEDSTIYETHRGVLRTIRRVLNPILKLFFNPNTISQALHIQAKANEQFHAQFRKREEMDPLYYELVHNLALEVTRLGVEVHNMKMRVESLSSRVDFDERRNRALEGVVQYRAPRQVRPDRPASQVVAGSAPAAAPVATASATTGQDAPAPAEASGPDGGDSERRRRRRRRRRRSGQTLGDQPGGGQTDGDTGAWTAEGGADDDAGSDEQ